MTNVPLEARALIGVESEPTTSEPISADELRRFVHATMEDDTLFLDPAEAIGHYGSVVAPPLYPVHAFRRPTASDDPLARAGSDPEWDGLIIESARSLPSVHIPLTRSLNGGSTVEIHSLAMVGERVVRVSAYEGFDERQGRSGPLVVVRTRSQYRTETGRPLLTVHQASIRR